MKPIVITGGNSGLGLEIAKMLAINKTTSLFWVAGISKKPGTKLIELLRQLEIGICQFHS